LPSLKTRSPGADDREMGPGGSLRRRSTTRAALMVALAGASLLAAAVPAAATNRGPAPSTGSAGSTGAKDTSIPQTPIVYPTAAVRSTASVDPTVTFSDLDASDGWAKDAIRWVAATNAWMRDYAANDDGTYPFRPDRIETRKQLARSVVGAFAPDEAPDASIVFPDLDASSAWYRYAAVAVKHGWIGTENGGAFAPDEGVTMATLHRALVLALGLKPAVKALNHLHTHAGQTFQLPRNFGTTLLGMRLYLRYNAPSGSESMDVAPLDLMSRARATPSPTCSRNTTAWSFRGSAIA
jgi:hypothetical protein